MSFTGKLTIHPYDYAYQNAYETLIRKYCNVYLMEDMQRGCKLKY